jgi:hypothetical protein
MLSSPSSRLLLVRSLQRHPCCLKAFKFSVAAPSTYFQLTWLMQVMTEPLMDFEFDQNTNS